MNELGGTLGGIFDTFLPEIARKKLEDSGLIQKQEPPATERTPRAVNRSTLPPWLIPVAAVAGVGLVLYLVLRKS
jgi:hypothetical protein